LEKLVIERDAIINPKKSKNSPDLGPVAVMAATRPDLLLLFKLFEFNEESFQPLFISRLYHDHNETGMPGISLAGPFVGAPYAAMLLETLIAWGARKILFVGWCGSVSESVKIGDIILPTSALIDEGTSRHYQNKDTRVAYPSDSILSVLRAGLDQKQIPFHQGPIWTTDAVYRETRHKVSYFQSRGAIGVEMEISALCTVAEFRGIEIAALVIVGDELTSARWHPGFKSDAFKQARGIACGVIIESCHKM
jgi:purine-nucleoside phosphorylase